jgi:hypothetical protein
VCFCIHLELLLNNKILELTVSLEELTIEMNSVQEALKKEEAGKIVRTYHMFPLMESDLSFTVGKSSLGHAIPLIIKG